MRIKNLTLLFILSLFVRLSSAHDMSALVPANTATHIAQTSGSWFSPGTWDAGTVPGNGSIVYIPYGIVIDYEGCSSDHVFIIRLDGEMNITQSNNSQTTCLKFDTFFANSDSYLKILANNPADGDIDITIAPFDIEGYKSGPNNWNVNALSHFSDGAIAYSVTYQINNYNRNHESLASALANNTSVTEASRSAYDDGPGVTGRYGWDPEQLSIGLVTQGQLEIIGQEKSGMKALSANANSGSTTIQLESAPSGWEVGDRIIVTRGGNAVVNNNDQDEATIASISGSTITTTSNLSHNHTNNPAYGLYCHVGNLDRNITFKSEVSGQIHQRGHFMHMHNNTNMQVRNAAFVDMGRTDKTKLTDDFRFDTYIDTDILNTKWATLGHEVISMQKNVAQDITNSRGRYSIHMHKTGAKMGDNQVFVTGNVVWGNPGWGITHHDSYADVSDNVVYDIIGAGIVAESGSELGTWDRNLVVEVANGRNQYGPPYDDVHFYDDHSFKGSGLALKGRGVLCRDNVIADAWIGVEVANMNPVKSVNNDRVDAELLEIARPGYEVDQFPLDVNGYSIEGDGVLSNEIALIMENTTVIWSWQAIYSIERDQGVNHESRSIFDGFYGWGCGECLQITYQADYSFKDVVLSGLSWGGVGVDMFKHSHNMSFEDIDFVDLGSAIRVSRFDYQSGWGGVRNNDYTPWVIVNGNLDNTNKWYDIGILGSGPAVDYSEHTDNTIHLNSSDVTNRITTFTIVDSSELYVDVASQDFSFEIDGWITDDFGTYPLGVEQSEIVGNFRRDYESRMYEFASQAKFEEYLTANGVFKDENDELYFIIYEALPNRRTFEYTSFPVRVKIRNAPIGGVYASPSIENIPAPYLLYSSFANVSQSSVQGGLSFQGDVIDASAWKAVDGNCNGRFNSGAHRKDKYPIGSFAQTQNEQDPWFDLELADEIEIKYIDIWNTVELNGENLEPNSTHFQDFYVLIADSPFSDTDLATSRAHATHEYYFDASTASKRKASLENLGVKGKYVRIQANGNTFLKIAEVEVIGKGEDQCIPVNLGGERSLCGQTQITLNSNLSLAGKTLTWTDESSTVLGTNVAQINVSAGGWYYLQVDSATCQVIDSVEVTTDMPQPDLGADIELCTMTEANLSTTINEPIYNYIWTRDGSTVAIDTNAISISEPGSYVLTLGASGCSDVTDSVVVTSLLLNVTNDTICSSGTANLSVSGAGTFGWYAASTGGTALTTGNTYSPSISSNTTFYVQDENSVSYNVGDAAPDLVNSSFTWGNSNWDWTQKFEVYSECTLKELSVWSIAATEVTANILATDRSTVLQTKTFTGVSPTTTETRLTTDFTLSPGTYYLSFTGTNGNMKMTNNNDPTVNYPYTIPGVLSITTGEASWGSFTNWYLFGYNWEVTTGSSCARTPVHGIIETTHPSCITSAASSPSEGNLEVYPNPTQDYIHLSQALEWKVMDMSGQIVLEGEGKIINLVHLPNASYFVLTPEGTTKVEKY